MEYLQNHRERRRIYHPHPSSSCSAASIKACCCCLFLFLCFLLLLLLAVSLVVILAVKPKKPKLDLQQVAVQNLGITTTASAVSVFESKQVEISFKIRMLFTAVNTNRVGIRYGESRFLVMYRGVLLGRTMVPGFYQDAHKVRNIEAAVLVDRVSLIQGVDAEDLVRDASINDSVSLTVTGNLGAKIRLLGFDSTGVKVSVNCSISISPMKQSMSSKQCGSDGLAV